MLKAPLIPIQNTETISQLKRQLRTVVTRCAEDGYAISKQSGWIAVPVESGEHFDEEDQLRILHTLLRLGKQSIVAVATENVGDYPQAYTVSVTQEGIVAFNEELSFLSFALFSGAPDWVILCTKEGYFVVIGPPDFVVQIVGTSIEDAFSNFQTFASDPWLTDEGRKYFLFLLNQLQVVYPYMDDGAEVLLRPAT